MKKFACLVLALAMILSLSITAGAVTAADITANNGTKNQDVTVTVTASISDTYHVVVKWTDTTFTYSFGTQTWDAEQHKYTGGDPDWDRITATVTVINHSNVAVNATVKFDGEQDTAVMINNATEDDVVATLTNNTLALGTGVGTGAGEAGSGNLVGNATDAPAGTATLTISGTPEANVNTTVTKPVTVKITKA